MHPQAILVLLDEPADSLGMAVKIDQDFIDAMLATQFKPDLQHGHAANREKTLGDRVG